MCVRCELEDVRDIGARGPRPFALPGAEPRYGRDRAVKIVHIRLEVTLEFERKRESLAVVRWAADRGVRIA